MDPAEAEADTTSENMAEAAEADTTSENINMAEAAEADATSEKSADAAPGLGDDCGAVSLSLETPAAEEARLEMPRLKSYPTGAYAGLLEKQSDEGDHAQQASTAKDQQGCPDDDHVSDAGDSEEKMVEVDWQQIQENDQDAAAGEKEVFDSNTQAHPQTSEDMSSAETEEHRGENATGTASTSPQGVGATSGECSSAKSHTHALETETSTESKAREEGLQAHKPTRELQGLQAHKPTRDLQQMSSITESAESEQQTLVPSSPSSTSFSEPWQHPTMVTSPGTGSASSAAHMLDESMVETSWASSLSHSSQRAGHCVILLVWWHVADFDQFDLT